MGIPTNIPQKDEKYSSKFKMYNTDGNNEFRIQWHRYEEGCPLHPLIQTVLMWHLKLIVLMKQL